MLIKIDNKIFNIDNVNLISYTERTENRPEKLTILFQRNQMDDTNVSHVLEGSQAQEFWTKIQMFL